MRVLFSTFIVAILALCERGSPWRDHRYKTRWPQNFLLIATSSLLAYLTIGFLPVASAIFASNYDIGLFQGLPTSINIILSVVALDFSIYWQHRFMHTIPLFWQLHKVHHTDKTLDVSSGIRFHPIEILASLLIKAFVILFFGCHVTGVIIFEITLNAASLFHHANINIPRPIEEKLEKLIITPSIHRVHHSVIPSETDSNYGFLYSGWDKLFSTKKQTDLTKIEIGLSEYKNKNQFTFMDLLLMPFK